MNESAPQQPENPTDPSTSDPSHGDLPERGGQADLDASGVERLREVITGSGAVDAVEAEIGALADSARLALKSTTGLASEPTAVLDQLIDFSTARSS